MILHNGSAPLYVKVVHPRADPSFADKAKNFAGAAKRVATAAVNRQRITVPKEEAARRMAICAGCEFFTGKTCRKCGCFIKFKARLETEHCPIAKW